MDSRYVGICHELPKLGQQPREATDSNINESHNHDHAPQAHKPQLPPILPQELGDETEERDDTKIEVESHAVPTEQSPDQFLEQMPADEKARGGGSLSTEQPQGLERQLMDMQREFRKRNAESHVGCKNGK